MKKKLTFFDKLMLVVAIFLVICLWLGVYAGVSDPRENIIVAFFGLAYPFFLFANLIMLAYWALRKKWIFSAITVLAICLGWNSLIATFGLIGTEGKDEKTEEGLIRVMTYNVHNFKPYGEDNTIEAKEKMLAVVKAQNPDVICFQEFFTKPKGPYDTVDSLKKMLDAKYYYFVPTQKTESEAIGFAIFSKYPIKNKGEIMFENSFGNGSIFVDLTVNKQDIRVYNVHLQSISFVKEDYNYLEKVTKQMTVEKSSSKRIVRMLKTAFQKRAEQVDVMKAHMNDCDIPFVVAGDFNDTPASYAVTKITDSLNNAFLKKGNGLGRTYNGKFPNFQIDYIATTKNIEVVNYHIVEAKLSDHFPVRSDLRLLVNNP